MSGVTSWNEKCNRCGIEKSFLDYECNTGEGNDGCSFCGASTSAYICRDSDGKILCRRTRIALSNIKVSFLHLHTKKTIAEFRLPKTISIDHPERIFSFSAKDWVNFMKQLGVEIQAATEDTYVCLYFRTKEKNKHWERFNYIGNRLENVNCGKSRYVYLCRAKWEVSRDKGYGVMSISYKGNRKSYYREFKSVPNIPHILRKWNRLTGTSYNPKLSYLTVMDGDKLVFLKGELRCDEEEYEPVKEENKMNINGYVDYQEKIHVDGIKGWYEEIYNPEDWSSSQLMRRIEYERAGFSTDPGGVETITITGFEITDYYVDHFCDQSAEIPETIMDTPVTAIAPYASNHSPNDNYLRSVTLPNTLKTVGKAAFADCEMEAVTIPASVTEIGEYAFGYNRKLDKRGEDGAEIGFEKIDGFVISCYPGTAGERYAKDNGFEYKLLRELNRSGNAILKGGEEMKLEELDLEGLDWEEQDPDAEEQVLVVLNRLIKKLKEKNWTSAEIVDLIHYICNEDE